MAGLIENPREANPPVGAVVPSASTEPGLGHRMAGLGVDAVNGKTAGPFEIADGVRRLGGA